jgi:hypothetical protein
MSELCHKCLNVKFIMVKPEARGWLWRPEFESREDKYLGIRCYKVPDGQLYALNRPWQMRVQCPVCNPHHKFIDPILELFKPTLPPKEET